VRARGRAPVLTVCRRKNGVPIMEFENLVTEKEYQQEGKSSSGGSRPTKSYEEYSEAHAKYVIANLKAHNGSFHIPAFSDDEKAGELPDTVIEALDLPEGSNESLEDLFGMDLEADYLGTAGDVEDSDGVVNRKATVEVMKGINGYHADLIEQEFGPANIGVGVGSSAVFDDDELRNKLVQFRVVDTEKSERTRKRAQFDVGEISESEYEEWCVNNEIHPWPRDKNAPSLDELREDYQGD